MNVSALTAAAVDNTVDDETFPQVSLFPQLIR